VLTAQVTKNWTERLMWRKNQMGGRGLVMPFYAINGKYGGYGFLCFPSIMSPGNLEIALMKQ
jgi:hypothetical protein